MQEVTLCVRKGDGYEFVKQNHFKKDKNRDILRKCGFDVAKIIDRVDIGNVKYEIDHTDFIKYGKLIKEENNDG